jgi:integrase/recombinase XerC
VLSEYTAALVGANLSQGTILHRVGDIQRLQARHPKLFDLTTADLAAYLKRSNWKPEYKKAITASFRGFYRWAHAEGLTDHNPAIRLEAVKVPRRAAFPPAPTDVVLSAFEHGTLPERAMIVLAATMGLRRTEIASLHTSHRHEKVLRVQGKNGTERNLTLDAVTFELLQRLERDNGPDTFYFPGRFGGHLHPATVYKWVTAHLGANWTLHSCRRRAATEGFRVTKNPYAVQRFLGHASITTTQIYVDVSASDVAAVANGASLGFSRSARHIAGLPPDQQENLSAKETFVTDLARLTAQAREMGMELALR